MKQPNSAISLLCRLGGACMSMTFCDAVRGSVDRMTPPKERKASRKLAGGFGRDLQAKFDAKRFAERTAAKTLAYANKR